MRARTRGSCAASHHAQKTLLERGIPAVTPFLHMSGISKRFGGTQALRSVDFTAECGEVHAIVGENGVGKSTLSRILTGAVQCDAGEIRLGGEPQAIASPLAASSSASAWWPSTPTWYPTSASGKRLTRRHADRPFGWWIDWAAAHDRVRQFWNASASKVSTCGGASRASARPSARSWRLPKPWR